MSDVVSQSSLTSSAQQLRTLVRVFGRTDGLPSWSAAKGHMYVHSDTGLPALVCPFVSIRVHTFEEHKDGFIERLIAAILPIADDGSTLRTQHVGLDGEERPIEVFPYRKAYFHCPHTGTHRVSAETGDIEDGSIWSGGHLAPFRLDITQSSGVAWVNYINPHELMGKTWSDHYRFRSQVHELFDQKHPFVPSTYGYVGESPLPPWVGGVGQAVWNAWGLKASDPRSIPEDIFDVAAKAVPDLVSNKPFVG